MEWVFKARFSHVLLLEGKTKDDTFDKPKDWFVMLHKKKDRGRGGARIHIEKMPNSKQILKKLFHEVVLQKKPFFFPKRMVFL